MNDCIARSKTLVSCQQLNHEAIRDHLPEYLDEVAEVLEQRRTDGTPEAVEKHVRSRFLHGFDVRDLIAEYQILRSVILRTYQAEVVRDGAPSLDEVVHLNETIDDSVRTAVDAFIGQRDQARDIFVGILGHDLRSPLQTITSAVELLVSDPGNEAVATRVGSRIRTSVAHMTALVGGLLEFARIHLGGGIPVRRTAVDLQVVVRDVLEELVLANPQRRIENNVTVAKGDFQGFFDATRIAQAVTNLVRNAVEHGRDPIVVDLYDEGEFVRIEVCNEGAISDDVRANLFVPFAASRSGGGLGLGLFIASEIARAHDGKAYVAADENRTCFSLSLLRSERRGSRLCDWSQGTDQ